MDSGAEERAALAAESPISADLPGGLSAEARSLYLKVLRSGGRTVRPAPEDDHSGPVRELQSLGLLVPDTDSASMLVVGDPRRLADSIGAELQTQAVDLLVRSISMSSSLQSLGREYQAHTGRPITGGLIDYVKGGQAINQQLAALLEDCSKEMLTAQPGGGRRSEAIRIAIERDMRFVQRGGTMRTIYQPSARYSAPTLEYVEAITHEGCQVRTVDEPFARLIVLDRKVAIIPVSDEEGEDRAAFVRDDAVIGYIVRAFDGLWERAIPFSGGRQIPPQVVSSLRHQIVRMMLQGTGHRSIARRLGLSERTLARHIAEMREEHEVDTLFQLGWKLAQLEMRAARPDEDDSPSFPLP